MDISIVFGYQMLLSILFWVFCGAISLSVGQFDEQLWATFRFKVKIFFVLIFSTARKDGTLHVFQ